jgi:hypothetical protein
MKQKNKLVIMANISSISSFYFPYFAALGRSKPDASRSNSITAFSSFGDFFLPNSCSFHCCLILLLACCKAVCYEKRMEAVTELCFGLWASFYVMLAA